MRRLFYPALILLPVLALSQAQAQTSTLNAPQSRATVATLEAKAETPNVLPAATATTSADPGTEIMVPVSQTVVERSSADAENKDVTPTYSNATAAATAPKLIEAKPLAMSLRDMESETAEASVVLQFTVDFTGTPRNVKVIHSGGAALDKRAVEAVNLYRFKPATQNGLAVEAPVSVEIKLKKS